jgi:branched-chain amino acid transport system substrate-binding protein
MRSLNRLVPVLLAVLALTGCGRRGSPDPILLGHLAPLSGPHKALGDQARQGILLAVEEVNKPENLIDGRRLVVLHVDTRGDAETAQHETVRLIKISNVFGLLGGTDVAEADRIAKAAAQNLVPLVTPCGAVTLPVGESVLSIGLAPAREGEVLARFTAQELKAVRVAVVVDSRDAAGAAVATAVAREFPHDGTHRLEEFAYKAPPEFADLIERVKKSRPQAVLHTGEAADFFKLRAALRQTDDKLAFLFGGSDVHKADVQADREGSRGVFLATAYVADCGTSQGQEFARKYEERFHEAPGAQAGLAYDGVRLLVGAIRRARTGRLLVREELWKEETFESLTGPLYPHKDRPARRTAFVVRLEDGQPKPVQHYEPPARE